MSEMDTPLDHAQDDVMPLVEWALTPMGHCNPEEEYANMIASINHQEMICYVTGPPLTWLPKPTKSCSGEHLRYKTQPWFQNDTGVIGPEFQANRVDGKGLLVSYSLDRRQCSNSRAVFNESTLRLDDCNGSNRGPSRALSTVGKSQGGTVRGCGGFILLAPRKN